MPAEMLDRYARLGRPIYHDLALALVSAPDRQAFYARYDFDIAPPTDDRPFFYHFFRWEQTPTVLESLGRRWQPFGGSVYFVLLALLAFAVAAAVIFVSAPVGLRGGFRESLTRLGARRAIAVLGYFALLGLAFLLVEIALVQRFVLVLGRPSVTLATVAGALLATSGLGSALSGRFPWRGAMVALALVLVTCPAIAGLVGPALLGLPLPVRLAGVVLLIAPVGVLMGIPFARGIAALDGTERVIAWAWAANGSASAVSAVLAALLSLSFGFTPVLLLGGGLYLVAALLPAALAPQARLPARVSPPRA